LRDYIATGKTSGIKDDRDLDPSASNLSLNADLPNLEKIKTTLTPQHKDLLQVLKNHVSNQNPLELHLMPSLSSVDRKIVHVIAEDIGLASQSQGEKEFRHLVLGKTSVIEFN